AEALAARVQAEMASADAALAGEVAQMLRELAPLVPPDAFDRHATALVSAQDAAAGRLREVALAPGRPMPRRWGGDPRFAQLIGNPFGVSFACLGTLETTLLDIQGALLRQA